MTIARLDLWHGFCPQTYECPLAVSTLIPVQNKFKCSLEGSDRNNNAYFVNESLAKFHFPGLAQCGGKIRVPISLNAIIDESAGVVHALNESLNQGFEMDYAGRPNKIGGLWQKFYMVFFICKH